MSWNFRYLMNKMTKSVRKRRTMCVSCFSFENTSIVHVQVMAVSFYALSTPQLPQHVVLAKTALATFDTQCITLYYYTIPWTHHATQHRWSINNKVYWYMYIVEYIILDTTPSKLRVYVCISRNQPDALWSCDHTVVTAVLGSFGRSIPPVWL